MSGANSEISDGSEARKKRSPVYNVTSSLLKPENDLWKSFSPLMDLTKCTIYRLGAYGVSRRQIGKCPHFAICRSLISHEQGPDESVNRKATGNTFKQDLGMPADLQPTSDDFDKGWAKAHIFAYEKFLKCIDLCFLSMSMGNVAAVVAQVNEEMKKIDKKGSKITSDHGGGLCIVSTHMCKDPLKIGEKKDIYVADYFVYAFIVRDRKGPKMFAFRTITENKLLSKEDGEPPKKKASKDVTTWNLRAEIAFVEDPIKELKEAGVPFTATADDFYSINDQVNPDFNLNSVICPINEVFFKMIEDEKSNVDKSEIVERIIDRRVRRTFGTDCLEHLTNSFQLNKISQKSGSCGLCKADLLAGDLLVKTKYYLGETFAVDYEQYNHFECFFNFMKSIGYSPTSREFSYANRVFQKDKDALADKLSPMRQTTLKF